MRKQWVFDPHSGGSKVSPSRKIQVEQRIRKFADQNFKGRGDKIEVRFRGALCYVALYIEYKDEPDREDFRFPLCRLRHFDIDRWSISLFLWSNEKYEPTMFPSGEWFGTIEECLEFAGSFLDETEF